MNKRILGLLALLFPVLLSAQVTTPGSGGGVGSSTNASGYAITNLAWHNTLFVDATNGNDTTYVIGDASKPARTVETALSAIGNNQNLFFRPGHYLIELFHTTPTNGVAFYGRTNVYMYGPGAVWYADSRGTMMAMGFCTNVTIDGITFLGVRNESAGLVNVQSGAIWIEGDSQDLTFKNLVVKNHINQGIITYRHPDALWGYRNIRVLDSHFEWIGFTNAFAGLPNDGTAIVICGDDTVVERNYFKFNLRDFETFTHNDAIPDQVWRNGRIVGNISVGAMEEFWAQGATNIQDWLIADNHIWQYSTNRQMVASSQKALHTLGGYNVIIERNFIHGSELGLVFKNDSSGNIARHYIRNNSFVAIGADAIYGWLRPNGTVPPDNIHIEGNTFYQVGGYGIVAGFNNGTIKNNVFIDVGTNGPNTRVISFGTSVLADSGALDLNPCTNTIISGNHIANSSPGSGVTDQSIYVGDRAYETYIIDNFIATDVNPIVNQNATTRGLLALVGGRNNNDFIGGTTTAGSLWTRTNATTGQGTWDNTPVLAGLAFTANEGSWLFSIGDNVSSDSLVITNTGFEGAGMSFSAESFRVHGSEMSTKSVYASNIYAANFIQTNGFNRSKFYDWGGTNVQWRMVKNITLTNVVDVSACAYYPSNGTFLTIHNNATGRITEWTLDGVFVRKIDGSGSGLADCEAIVYMGGDRFAIVEEDLNNIYNISVSGRASGSTWATNESQMFELPASIGVDASGSGVEGIAYDWDRNLWWIAKEKNPAQLLIVTNSGGVWYTNNWFTTAQMQTFTNANNTDFSDLFLDRDNQILWVAQDEGAASQTDRVIGIDLLKSNVLVTVSITNMGQLEGVSMTPDGKLLVAGEANQFAIFEPFLGGLNSSMSWTKNTSTNLPDTVQFPFGWSVGPSASQAVFTNVLTASATLDFASTSSGARQDLPITVSGAKEGDYVTVAPPTASTTSIIGTFSGFSSNGAVFVRFVPTAAAQDPASGTFRIIVHQAR